MRRPRKLCLLVLLLSCAAAWRAAWHSTLLAAPQPETEKCTVEGIVTAIPTGAPLKGARVSLNALGTYRSLYHTRTDAAGQFVLSGIEPGKYDLRADKDGYDTPYVDCNSDAIQNGDTVTLVSGQNLPRLKLQLLAPAVVTGTVYDPAGDPLAGAEVEAVSLVSFSGTRLISSATEPARTDDRGQYRIFHLKPGQYFLRVSDAFYFFRQRVEEEGNENKATTKIETEKQVKGSLPIYYPDTTDLSQATLFELKPGEELAAIDFTIHSAQVLRIRGRVVNGLTGEPIREGSVATKLLPPSIRENSAQSRQIGEDSRFQIDDLVPGRYVVSVNAFVLPDRHRWGGWQEVDLTDSSADDVQVKVFPGHDLQGRILLLGNQKVDSRRLQVALEPHGDLGYGGAFTDANPDGAFLLLEVKQDIYDVEIHGLPEGYYLKSARLGTVAATDDGLRIGGEPSTAPLILEVSPAGAQVEGVVQTPNGKSACTATVVLIPDAPRRSIHRYYQSTEVDRFGHFTLAGITPGSYKLFAFDNVDEVGYFDPASLQPYENLGQPVHFDEGDRRTISLTLISTSKNYP
jgi:hypothetical protein